MLSLLVLVSFVCLAQSFKVETTPGGVAMLEEAIARKAKSQEKGVGVVTNIFGRTALSDSGTHQRIIDVVGTISLTNGALSKPVILDVVAQGEVISDGIGAYDSDNNQVFFASDGAFGGTVIYANMTNLSLLPPAAYYLLPVVYLDYDVASGSRVIAGVNTPQKSFLVLERPNFGEITYFLFPPGIQPTANDAFDGKSQNYYNVYCADLGKCDINVWNLNANKVTGTYPLSCLPANGYLTGTLWVDPNNSDLVRGILSDPTLDYSLLTYSVKTRSCTSVALTGLPPKPHIIVATETGPKSGDVYVSVTSDVYDAIVIYDNTGKLQHTVKTAYLYEDIFVQEK